MSSNTQFAQQVYDFQMAVFSQLIEDFEGKVVGSEDCNLEKLKEKFFEGYNPENQLVKSKKGVKKEKKPRALSGYTYFGQQNKAAFNEEMEKMDEKPKYVSFVGTKWKSLSKEEQEEWNKKAQEAFEKSTQ